MFIEHVDSKKAALAQVNFCSLTNLTDLTDTQLIFKHHLIYFLNSPILY